MAFIKKKIFYRKSKDRLRSSRTKGVKKGNILISHFFRANYVIEASLFMIFLVLIGTICFLGQKPKGPRIILNQAAHSRIVAEFPFKYISQVYIEAATADAKAEVPPVFERTFKPFDAFSGFIDDLNNGFTKNQIEFEDKGEETLRAEMLKTANSIAQSYSLEIKPEAIDKLSTLINPRDRSTLFEGALNVLRSLYEDGIYPSIRTESTKPQVAVIQLIDEEGRYNLPEARSLDDALITLRARINKLSRKSETSRVLFDIFRVGLITNLVYSEEGTNRAISRAIDLLEPELVQFEEGETLIEPGKIVTPADIERITQYRLAELDRKGNSLLFNKLFIERLTLTSILLIITFVYIKESLVDVHRRHRAIFITAVSILLNLLIIRIIMELGESAFADTRPSLSMLPYVAPYALAPILVAVLAGGAPAVLSALIIAVIFGIIQNNSVEFILIAFLSGVVGGYVSNNIRKRSKLVRAGLIAGATAGLAGAAIGILSGFSLSLIGQQSIVALIVGLLTGVLAVGLLPIFEQLFKITTEITLLELTDFNHPILRRMQMEAPGTYHHSLMVANLSENAAAAIGASPLLCRVCCLFHDIGKLVKPEYFTENQRDKSNPHDEKNPSMSALVIKAHVKEGVEMARKEKLPQVITDVIRQHHGTTLIQYFYRQAQEKEKKSNAPLSWTEKVADKREREESATEVDESTYRYDGPKPEFKESAIIFFADSLEAASRSLKKVSQPNIEELIDQIFKDRIEDGQLDKCPLTFHELALIRESFIYTLLNMQHARIEYPKSTPDGQNLS